MPPKLVIKSESPVEVTESVTIIEFGFSSSTIEDINAISAFLFISFPSLLTIAALSTSVSKIIPKSALLLSTASFIEFIASSFSGLGIWLGKFPSGSVN
ncbi:hypothetical protein CLBKI_51520 [Clostridium beijerinckii]|nr:hypothetical protein CLBKI_51520 [Clostridium beijerinckii]